MQTVVITGGAGGMGLATARIMGGDHRVVVSDVSEERVAAAVAELRGLGVTASGAVADVADRASVDALLARAADGGRVRAVVHAAGVSPQMGAPDFIVRVNATGTINVTEAFLAIAGEGDALVNVASIAGHMSPRLLLPKRAFRHAFTDTARLERRLLAATRILPERSRSGAAYGTSKAFVIWYSRRMAAAFGTKGARILSVSPGSFDTAMGRLEEKSGSARLLEFAALKRFGRPEEIAELLAFCASDRPGYLTGTDILVDGGTRAGLDWRGMLAMARRS